MFLEKVKLDERKRKRNEADYKRRKRIKQETVKTNNTRFAESNNNASKQKRATVACKIFKKNKLKVHDNDIDRVKYLDFVLRHVSNEKPSDLEVLPI